MIGGGVMALDDKYVRYLRTVLPLPAGADTTVSRANPLNQCRTGHQSVRTTAGRHGRRGGLARSRQSRWHCWVVPSPRAPEHDRDAPLAQIVSARSSKAMRSR